MLGEGAMYLRTLRFLTKRQVRDKTTLSYAEIDRREHRCAFPKRHRLSAAPRGRVVWWEHEIDEWMVSQSPHLMMETRPLLGSDIEVSQYELGLPDTHVRP
jgi:predicted DNA-binding transcriptional regulator AlpA